MLAAADRRGPGVTVPSVTVNVSLPSTTTSPVTLTVIVCVSLAVPAKVSGLVVTAV